MVTQEFWLAAPIDISDFAVDRLPAATLGKFSDRSFFKLQFRFQA